MNRTMKSNNRIVISCIFNKLNDNDSYYPTADQIVDFEDYIKSARSFITANGFNIVQECYNDENNIISFAHSNTTNIYEFVFKYGMSEESVTGQRKSFKSIKINGTEYWSVIDSFSELRKILEREFR